MEGIPKNKNKLVGEQKRENTLKKQLGDKNTFAFILRKSVEKKCDLSLRIQTLQVSNPIRKE